MSAATVFLAVIVAALIGGCIVTAVRTEQVHAADNEARARRKQPRMTWLDCEGPCRRLHGPHFRHTDGRITCCLCGGIHSASIPRQRGVGNGT